MCGIVGYTGEKQAAPILLAGLEKLEYRGYDSAGIAVEDGAALSVVKAKGRLAPGTWMISRKFRRMTYSLTMVQRAL